MPANSVLLYLYSIDQQHWGGILQGKVKTSQHTLMQLSPVNVTAPTHIFGFTSQRFWKSGVVLQKERKEKIEVNRVIDSCGGKSSENYSHHFSNVPVTVAKTSYAPSFLFCSRVTFSFPSLTEFHRFLITRTYTYTLVFWGNHKRFFSFD